MKHLDGNGPVIEVSKQLQVIKQYQPVIQDMERRLQILQKVEPILEQAIKILT
jgi:hypothetical protein